MYSRTPLIGSRYVCFSSLYVRNREHKKTAQYCYAYFLPNHMLPENTIFWHQRSVDRQTAILWYAFRLLYPVQTRKGKRHTWSKTVAALRSSFPTILTCASHMKKFLILVPANPLPGCRYTAFTAITANSVAIILFTYLFHYTWAKCLWKYTARF